MTVNGLDGARHAAGLTQSEVARRLGKTQAQVSRIETADLRTLGLGTVSSYLDAVGGACRLSVTIGDTAFSLAVATGAGIQHSAGDAEDGRS